MTAGLQLFFHPLSSFCWKALIGLYESGISFESIHVDLQDSASRAAFLRVWPLGKMPVLRDQQAARTVPEASLILEYLAQTDPRARWLIPTSPDEALEVRLRDRVFDLHVQIAMQKIVGDRLRPAAERDRAGVQAARASLDHTLAYVENQFSSGQWPAGEPFTLADCAAFPALYYSNRLAPLAPLYPTCAGYLLNLAQRPSISRTLREAEPYAHWFPAQD